MFKIRFASGSAGKTRKLGEALGAELRKGFPKSRRGIIIRLKGNLGSGKTTFIQGIARGLGLRHRIVSPTFLLMRVYPFTKQGRSKKLLHIDAYRIATKKDAAILENKKFFENPLHIIVVEWPERIPALVRGPAIQINFLHGARENERSIIIQTKP
ncbi:MAG: tRNA (adenosine(37)-N6)-threonylcarbamoyltransferase complex ATPase subunit type 1 TsaE [Candidatus Jorgensenbacteria bacterium]|nr:tRNA (adenosine(37)-N6)-threonylcarbamoyltransferase complex ATPase subunit type 1 TsaE [Candidatus Jorgensenbacteria bacterium]